ncbi:phosphoserine phosphatase-like [Oscarella lobularis]|uniref:phosphoserine phosphatase-like n=1 Tax=Oscarella lobularis TaxID=121494 RepID=UPI0033143564
MMNGTECGAIHVWRSADAVCFDVDSTVCQDEGIDDLATFRGVGERVKEWTKKAMGGAMSFRVALTERLKIINLTRDELEEFLATHPPRLSPGIEELVALLRERGVDVYLVSGGFESLIAPMAKRLNIPKENIFANRLRFFFNGDFGGFDESRLTSDSGGKKFVVQSLKQKFGYKNLVMIGDGATDMEAYPPADTFIGFGGNRIRQRVKEEAPWFVTSFQELIDALQ